MVAVPVVPSITDSEECNKKKTAGAHSHFPNEFHLDEEKSGARYVSYTNVTKA